MKNKINTIIDKLFIWIGKNSQWIDSTFEKYYKDYNGKTPKQVLKNEWIIEQFYKVKSRYK
jgi:hypothetical protein